MDRYKSKPYKGNEYKHCSDPRWTQPTPPESTGDGISYEDTLRWLEYYLSYKKDLPEELLLPTDQDYEFYMCRTGWWNKVWAQLKFFRHIHQHTLSGDLAEEIDNFCLFKEQVIPHIPPIVLHKE